MQDMPRVIVTDHEGAYLFDIDPMKAPAIVAVDEINGERSLTVTTEQKMEKEQRVLLMRYRSTGDELIQYEAYWSEYVVVGETSEHVGRDVVGTYYCVWSLQHDLEVSKVSSMPGVQSPVRARYALNKALEGQTGWTVGEVEPTDILTGASMYMMSGWEALGVVVQNWGGEVEAEIAVNGAGVTSRKVNLRTHIGASDPTRRFDYGYDCTAVRRTVSDSPYPCRIIPRGKGEATDSGGYGRRIDIKSVNGGVEWLENADAVPLVRLPSGDLPTSIVIFDQIETPAELKEYALAHLTDYTTPSVSYEAAIVDFKRYGLATDGIELGDEVIVSDDGFYGERIKVQARLVKVTADVRRQDRAELEISTARGTLADQFTKLQRSSDQLGESIRKLTDDLATEDWLRNLVTRLAALAGTTTRTTEPGDVASAASGFEVTAASFAQWGRMAQLHLAVKTDAALAAGTSYTIATVNAGKRPAIIAGGVNSTNNNANGQQQIGTSGAVTFRPTASVAAGTTVYVRSTYILP